MKEINKCACCGKFKPWKDLMGMAGEEADGEWFECVDCMSGADLEHFNKIRRPHDPTQ